MYKFYLLLVITTVTVSSCCTLDYDKEDFEFSKKELKFLGNYQIGDTIYFESNLSDVDTITVVGFSEERYEGSKCFISRAPLNYMSINIIHLPLRINKFPSTKWTIDENGNDITSQILISISKSPLHSIDGIASYVISYKGFTTLVNALGEFQKECIINDKTLSDCYKITHGYPERIVNPNDIEIVYWTAKYGLTAYTSKSGETWFIKDLE